VTPTLSALRVFGCSFLLCAASVGSAHAQASTSQSGSSPANATSAGSAAVQAASDDDAALDVIEPDFTVVNIPTTLRLPRHKGNFHLTHRFNGNLEEGSFGDQASTLFGLDRGATIGFEYRFGIARHVEAAVYRSSFEQTIQFSGKLDAIHQNASNPLSLSGLISVEGTSNFHEQFKPALGVVASREIVDRLAVYAAPVWVHNSASAISVDRDTFYVGLGGRVRVGSTVYLVGEVSPRAGYAPGQVEFAFGIEKRVGAHVFQLNFANTFGTTFGQIARGGSPDALYLGFNLTRKFF
jgi:uncharacterized beta barrel domain-containing protein DUF5777